MTKTKCPVCESENRAENRFCTQCGTNLGNSKAAPLARLVRPDDPIACSVVALKEGRTSIGRGPENTVVLNDNLLSRRHAAIYKEENHYWIEDLESKNGVYLNGKRISGREKLLHGSLIKMGSSIFRFEIS